MTKDLLPRSAKKVDPGAFLLGFLSFLNTRLFATLIYVELFAVVMLFLHLIGSAIKRNEINSRLKLIFFLGGGWGLQQAIVDYSNRTPFIETVTALAQIFVLCTLIYFALTWFQASPDRIKYFLIGLCFSSIPQYFLQPGLYSRSDPWKFSFGFYFTILFFIWLSIVQLSPALKISFIMLVAGLHIFLGSRSLALITFLVIPFLFASAYRGKKASSFLLIIVLIFTFGIVSEKTYKGLAYSGALGVAQQSKAIAEFHGGPLLLVARNEFLYEIVSIKNHWLLGSGSKPDLSIGVATRVFELESNLGFHFDTYTLVKKSGKVPQHSMLFSAWLEGGIFGLFFWLFLMYKMIQWQRSNNTSGKPFGLLGTFLFINFGWAVIFSPLGAGSRMEVACIVAVLYFQSSISGSELPK